MRCLACDKRLNDRESVRKSATSGAFIDLCDRCFATVADDIPDIEEGDFPADLPEEEDGNEGADYQQYLGGNCDDC